MTCFSIKERLVINSIQNDSLISHQIAFPFALLVLRQEHLHLNELIFFPAAYFYASTYKTADSRGFRLRDENNNGDVIRRYRKEGVTLTLPEGKNLNNIKIFYVWCEEFDVSYCFFLSLSMLFWGRLLLH